jgi:hypothetical protein
MILQVLTLQYIIKLSVHPGVGVSVVLIVYRFPLTRLKGNIRFLKFFNQQIFLLKPNGTHYVQLVACV